MKTTFGILVGIFLAALAAGKVEYLRDDDDTIVVEGKPLTEFNNIHERRIFKPARNA